MAKRRVRVTFEDDSSPEGSVKHQRKVVVSVDSMATNGDLAKEIAKSLNKESDTFVLELPGGFELRPEDSVVDTIREDEVVTARVISTNQIQSQNALSANPVKQTLPSQSQSYPSKLRYIASNDRPSRIQIRLVSAELARRHAAATLNDSTAVDGILAFEGEFISGNTTLNALRREVARVFGWISENNLTMDDDDESQCDHQHDMETACSCALAREIEQYGLFSTLHCRFTLDGEQCSNQDCPYSHIKLNRVENTTTPPHCIICGECLGFPCSKCLQHALDNCLPPLKVLHCPLVQNAGCGHLHHAHCFRMNKNAKIGCPTGCPRDKFPREAAVFDPPTPHIVVVWDGDKIDKIPIVTPQRKLAQTTPLQLTSEEVISLVQEFLTGKEFALPGLSLRIHSRDASTETVKFSQSTLVSICHASTHIYQTHHRFQVFPEMAASQTRLPLPCQRGFQVDLHTSQSPIVACGCTPLRDLFCTEGSARFDTSIVLYAVKRHVESGEADSKGNISAQKKTYLFNKAWQPSVLQTDRGMAALLTCLYHLAHLNPLKVVTAEASLLSTLYQVTRFPPAVRALGILFLNKDLQLEERAALSEAIYHALKDFLSRASRGPTAIITNPNRFFEAARIFLAHVMEISKTVQFPTERGPLRPLEEVSLVCPTSRKLLKNPIIMDSQIVNRATAVLHQPGGELYRPSSMSIIVEMTSDEAEQLKRLLIHCGPLAVSDSKIQSIMVINVEKLIATNSFPGLDQIGRDLMKAIENANKTSMVTRGPLDLKSTNIIPPQIVLDQEGFLAVFTGRGCGISRDVNFFRPMNGGDTEVDVNDVSYSLQKVIEQRRIEDTWQIDTFGGVSAAPIRPPDEAIILCLDLSQSMNERSGVSHPKIGHDSEGDKFDYKKAAQKLLEELCKNVGDDVILKNAKDYLRNQHPSVHWSWKCHINNHPGSESYLNDIDFEPVHDLLCDLGKMTRRDALKLSFTLDTNGGNSIMNEKMVKLAHFSTSCDKQLGQLAKYLTSLLYNLNESEDIGVEPYHVPRRLIDFRTGDLLLNPILPNNAPNLGTFVNEDSRDWFKDQASWPSGHFGRIAGNFFGATAVKNAVAEWVSGKDILPVLNTNRYEKSRKGKNRMQSNSETCGDLIQVTFVHMGRTTVWDLSINTTTRVLYCLVHRATEARYSSFSIRLKDSKVTITDSACLTLGLTELSHGGEIEISFAFPHARRLSEVTVRLGSGETWKQVVLLPQDAPILALLGHLDPKIFGDMSDMQLWHNIKSSGDGFRTGAMVENENKLYSYVQGFACTIDKYIWTWNESGERKEREKSRYLNRLEVLKELFNVFINRASSFDTSVSLVLGLVTFSSKASVKHELTPIFESFRQELDKVSAGGDTAVYDALETARRMLVNYKGDRPNLRKRIIIITDGADTSSEASASNVCLALQRSNIVVDSVQVGIQSDNTLHAISVATGGYRFCPQTSLSDALSIFDLETMLYSAERTARPPRPPVLYPAMLAFWGNTIRFPVDVVTITQFPSRAAHVKLQESVKPVANLISVRPSHDNRTKRIMRELQALVADPHPQMDLYVNDSDISFLKIVLEAPKDNTESPYHNGTFLFTCDIPPTYPRDPPEVRFVTFILHPNVSKQGKVCVAELGRLWSSDITLKEIFSQIYGLLLEPDLENPIEVQASLKYYDDDGTFALAVAEAVAEHASKSREQWRLELSDES